MDHYFGNAIIRYKGKWVIAECSNTIPFYYSCVLKNLIGREVSTPKFGSHVSLVAGKYENKTQHPLWGKYQDKEVIFKYNSKILTDNEWFYLGEYFWLEVECFLFGEIRKSLGLNQTPFHPYHLTIGKRNI